MTEPELEGMGVSSASRRRFMWLGGGMVASLLLLPELSFAAKVSKAVKKASTGSSVKAATPAKQSAKSATQGRSSARSTATTKSSSAKSSRSASASSSKSARSSRSAKAGGKGSDTVASRKAQAASKGNGGVASRRDNPRGRVVTTARADELERGSDLALPEDFAPTRAFSFGGDSPASRELSFYCVHTGEQLNIDYFVDGRYEPDALEAIDHLLRDYHNDEICQIDPRVLNQLYDLRRALGSTEAFHVFSGYRSPATNESYRRISGRVAEHSYHMTGQAIDIQLPGRDIRQLRNVAVAMRAGGVGYYPSEGFVHLDSGPIRRW